MAKKSEIGQAVIEYVILLSIILTMSGILIGGVKETRDKLWKKVICEVSAACPSCRATADARLVLPDAGACPN